ncbi:hypothetical protein P4O66_002933 [Electrophorus voltai]|uniref:BCR activator of RhoGEF and GTPase n=1 Tax=Electrophorus voltai TaxID=2609070 RepID=A0AAD9DLZ0_9TELE|nr:hypothetical protein P4O66_002933 [Electrophorus voltai]
MSHGFSCGERPGGQQFSRLVGEGASVCADSCSLRWQKCRRPRQPVDTVRPQAVRNVGVRHRLLPPHADNVHSFRGKVPVHSPCLANTAVMGEDTRTVPPWLGDGEITNEREPHWASCFSDCSVPGAHVPTTGDICFSPVEGIHASNGFWSLVSDGMDVLSRVHCRLWVSLGSCGPVLATSRRPYRLPCVLPDKGVQSGFTSPSPLEPVAISARVKGPRCIITANLLAGSQAVEKWKNGGMAICVELGEDERERESERERKREGYWKSARMEGMQRDEWEGYTPLVLLLAACGMQHWDQCLGATLPVAKSPLNLHNTSHLSQEMPELCLQAGVSQLSAARANGARCRILSNQRKINAVCRAKWVTRLMNSKEMRAIKEEKHCGVAEETARRHTLWSGRGDNGPFTGTPPTYGYDADRAEEQRRHHDVLPYIDDSPSSSPYLSSKSRSSRDTLSSGSLESAKSAELDLEKGLEMRKWVLSAILASEETYLSHLEALLLPMKPLKAAATTSQPVLTVQQIETIFFKVPELYEIHKEFYDGLLPRVQQWSHHQCVGDLFQKQASQLGVYRAFVDNYELAVETAEKCCQANAQFAEISENLKVRSTKECKDQTAKYSLETLLYKPVDRVTRSTLVLHDLLKHTPSSHPDHPLLQDALRISQNFLSSINEESTPRRQAMTVKKGENRQLLKDGFMVELVEGTRKLRHVFLFTDLLLCAKLKKQIGGKSQQYDCKWYVPLPDLTFQASEESEPLPIPQVPDEELDAIKIKISSLRNEIQREKRANKGSKVIERLRKKLSEQESLLLLTSPSMALRVHNRNGKVQYTTPVARNPFSFPFRPAFLILGPTTPWTIPVFLSQRLDTHWPYFSSLNSRLCVLSVFQSYMFLTSSDYERAEWKDMIREQQKKCFKSFSLNSMELQMLTNSCLKLQTVHHVPLSINKEEEETPGLHGFLTVIIHSASGLKQSSNLYCTLEVDSFGLFVNKAKTRVYRYTTEPKWNEEFEIELEGSQTLRLLCYEKSYNKTKMNKEGSDVTDRIIGKGQIPLDTQMLQGKDWQRTVIPMNGIEVKLSMKFTSREFSLKRMSSCKQTGVFGVKISTVTKRERSKVPYIVRQCLEEIERRGMEEVGIYRVSGVATDIQALKTAFDTNNKDVSVMMSEMDVNAIAGTLKLYFRELPEPLFTDELYPNFAGGIGQTLNFTYRHTPKYTQDYVHGSLTRFCSDRLILHRLILRVCAALSDSVAKESCMLNLLLSLPEPNLVTFLFLLDHLKRVAEKESVNKMSLHNLATVFGPTLLRPAEKDSKIPANPTQPISMGDSWSLEVMSQVQVLLYFLQLETIPTPDMKNYTDCGPLRHAPKSTLPTSQPWTLSRLPGRRQRCLSEPAASSYLPAFPFCLMHRREVFSRTPRPVKDAAFSS